MLADDEDHWEVHDRYGNRIYLTRERWLHIIDRRPWLEPFHGAILETLRRGRRRQDPLQPLKYKYYSRCLGLFPDFNHLVVVVLFGETTDELGRKVPNNYAVTAWAVFIYSERSTP